MTGDGVPTGDVAAETCDALLGQRVKYTQPAHGYRVSLEAPLLARFAIDGRSRPFRHAIDLGSGPGAIALCLLVSAWTETATALEPDPVHAELARRNAVDNGVASRMVVDARRVGALVVAARLDPLATHPRADLVISNPPYFEPSRGPSAEGETRARSRAFVEGSLDAFVVAARLCLGRQGRLVVAFPTDRFAELRAALARNGLPMKRARMIHPRENRDAQVVFVEAKVARAGGLVVQPPLFVRERDGEAYTREAADALWGRWPTPTARSAGAPAMASSASGSESGPDRG